MLYFPSGLNSTDSSQSRVKFFSKFEVLYLGLNYTNFPETAQKTAEKRPPYFFLLEQRFNPTRSDLWWLKYAKIVVGRGSTPEPAGGAHNAPPDPLVGWGGGYPLPIPHLLDDYGVSISAYRISFP